MLIVKLPFPAPELFPNRKNGKHWTATSAIKTAQNLEAWACTKDAMSAAGLQEWPEHIPLSLVFAMPDKRHRDMDNCLAASKAILDGMAEALAVNDKRFKPVLIDWVHGDKQGALIAAVGVKIISGVPL